MTAAPRPLCIVPARGGSKRFPRKNVALLAGRPLLAWTIDAAVGAGVFDRVWVSSEDEEILRLAEQSGGAPLPRAPRLAGDQVTVAQLCLEIVDELPGRESYDALYVLLPTSPLRRSETIRRAWQTFCDSGVDALLSVVPLTHPPPQWALVDRNGTLAPLFPHDYERPRQELTPAWRHDGGHAIARIAAFLRDRDFLGAHTVPFRVPDEEAVDVDDPADLAWAEFLIARGVLR
jgi:N-acylneuraminate cytidylyltransferase